MGHWRRPGAPVGCKETLDTSWSSSTKALGMTNCSPLVLLKDCRSMRHRHADKCRGSSTRAAGSPGLGRARAPIVVATLLVVLFMGVGGPARGAGAAAGFSEEEIRFESDDVTLRGTVLFPDKPGRKPAIALVHGAGTGPRERVRREAEAFARGASSRSSTTSGSRATRSSSGRTRSWPTTRSRRCARCALAPTWIGRRSGCGA